MGLIYNHLATLIVAVLASILTLLWHDLGIINILDDPMFVDYAGLLDIFFILAVPITWFLTAVCFVSQISADYMHGDHKPKKSTKKIVYTTDGIISE
jgi:hypothetical protein